MTWSEHRTVTHRFWLVRQRGVRLLDADCTTAARSTTVKTCRYDLNDSHTLNKYNIELRSTAYTAHALTFEVNVSADPPLVLTIDDVLPA